MKRTILMLEGDDDDRFITQSMFDEMQASVKLVFVINSNELMKYLAEVKSGMSEMPAMVLLSYRAAPMNGVDILKTLKADPLLRCIPVVVLSDALPEPSIRQCYSEGAVSVIIKAVSSQDVDRKIGAFIRYWFQTVELV